MSTPVPPILQTHTPFPYPILSAFPVHFPAFPHKRNDTLSCPQRKKRTKTQKGTPYCPVHSLSVYTKGPIYCPQIRFPRINGATKGIIKCPSYYLSLSERDNILSPLCTVYLRERDNIMSPSAYPFSVFSPRGRIKRGAIYCPSHAQTMQKTA